MNDFAPGMNGAFLGCSIERWLEIQSIDDLNNWLDENPLHRESEVGFFIRFARLAGLDLLGKGSGRFLSYGNFTLPARDQPSGN